MRIYLNIFIFFTLGLFSCATESSSARMNKDNETENIGYEKQIKQFKFKLTPISSENLLALNYKNQTISENEVTKIQKEYEGYWSFRFEIVVDGFKGEISEYYDKNDDKVEYDKLLNYYLFEMQNDLKIISETGEETLCNVYFFERNYELTKSNRFIIAFKKPIKDNNSTFSYDNRYLNIGKVNFQINKKDFLS